MMIINQSKHTRKTLSVRLRLSVPTLWVLTISLSFATASTPSLSVLQFWLTDPGLNIQVVNTEVVKDSSEHLVDQSTSIVVSCGDVKMVNYLSSEQKQVVKYLYKNGEKITNSESRIDFLNKSLENNSIPKSFKLKNNLPGNPIENQKRLDKVSIASIIDEKVKHENILKAAQVQFVKSKLKLNEVFDTESAEKELERVDEHLKKIRRKLNDKKAKKINRDTEKQGEPSQAENVSGEETIPKRRRKFRRKYLQPQPKRIRKRRTRNLQTVPETIDGWNGIIKNISGEEVTDDKK